VPNNLSFLQKTMLVVGALVLVIFASQWLNLNWGRLELAPTATVTVTGQADGQQTSQVANFSASVTANDADKQVVTNTVNEQMEQLITALKEFGIPDQDLQTNSISVYEYNEPEREIMILTNSVPPSPPNNGKPMWQASNTISITLREISHASDLATLLTESGATNVFGPNFTVDDTIDLDRQLLTEAMADARAKAELLLAGTNQRIKRVISVSETGTQPPMPFYREAGVGVTSDTSLNVPVEPGSQTLYKSVVVIFEIGR
jgi:hypothetical protein